MNGEVLLALERHDLLSSRLRPSRKDDGGDTARSGYGTGGSREIGDLDVVDADVSQFDVLSFKLSTKGSSVESRA